MISHHRDMSSPLTLMTTLVAYPFGYGRIITNDNEQVTGIVEEKDATPDQRRSGEINAGIYLVDRQFLFTALKQVRTDNSQGEVYLTDIVAIANRQGHTVNRFIHSEPVDVLGVNSRVELAQAHTELQRRRNTELMLAGVTMYGPETIYIAQGIPVGQDTVIQPGVQITGYSSVGLGCLIENGVSLHDCAVANNAIIGARSALINWPVQPCLSITISSEPVISQPAPFSGGRTVSTTQAQIDMTQESGTLHNIKTGASLADVVKALNALGATPIDLISILQAMKAAGALRAELEII